MSLKNRFRVSILEGSRKIPGGDFLPVLLILMLGGLCYSNTLNSPFVYDDASNILGNTNIRISELSVRDLFKAGFGGHLKTRPLAYISFALNYYINGFAVQGYHIVNIAIHLLTGVFLYLFLTAILTKSISENSLNLHHRTIAFFAAAIWLVHPVQTQSVTYIVQRMNSMASMFYVMSLFFYVKARDSMVENRLQPTESVARNTTGESGERGTKTAAVYFFFSAAAGFVALFTKEIAVTLPVIIFLVEWFFYRGLDKKWIIRNGTIWLAVLAILVAAVASFVDFSQFSYRYYDFNLSQRFMTEFRVVATYIGLVLYPDPGRLNLDYDYTISTSLLRPPTTILALLLIIALVVTAAALAKRQRLISFCILWFLINLAIESSFIPLDIIFEHRLYLPSMTVWLLIVLSLFKTFVDKRLLNVLFCTVLLLFGSWAWQRNAVWSDRETLWRDAVSKAPMNSHAHTSLGRALQDKGNIPEAFALFKKAVKLQPRNEEAHYRLGFFYLQGKKYEPALRHLKIAVELDEDFPETYFLIGNAYFALNDYRAAVANYSKALKRNPEYANAFANRGAALSVLGHFEKAISDFEKALTIDPAHRSAKINLGKTVSAWNQRQKERKAAK